jgi:agmatine deiminase
MNQIYIADSLTKKFPQFYNHLKQQLVSTNLQLKIINGTKDVWCRDYMPVQNVLFKYTPSYLVSTKSGRASISNQKEILENLEFTYTDCTDVVLDGGAIEVFGKAALVSDRFLPINNRDKLIAKIKSVLDLNKLVIIPADPWDFTGHVDGLVRFIDSENLLINDYTELEKELNKSSRYIQKKYYTWKRSFDAALSEAGFNVHALASAFQENTKTSSASGIYLNFLLLNDYLIMPAFRNREKKNEEAALQLQQFYKRKIISIEADDIAERGGVVNCVTWCP